MTESSMTKRDRLGARRIFVDVASGARAESLHALLSRAPGARRGGLDALGIDGALGLADAPDRTCLAAVRAVPPARPRARTEACAGVRSHPRLGAVIGEALSRAMARALDGARKPVVALGGGIDAPLAVLAARRAGHVVEHALHVSLPGTSYDEAEAARATADALSLSLHEIELTIDELAAELPRAVRLAETPLYNLHPVSRSVLARVARDHGHDVLLTGDGADQAARGATEPADYVPIVAAVTHASGLALASPFLDDEVLDLVLSASPQRTGAVDKPLFRALARSWGLAASIADAPKFTGFAPPLPRAAFPGAEALARLGALTERAPGFTHALAWSGDDRLDVGIASLAAFVQAFEIEAG